MAFAIVPVCFGRRGRYAEQFSAAGQVLCAMTIAEKAVMTDPLETIRQDVHQKPAQKFVRR